VAAIADDTLRRPPDSRVTYSRVNASVLADGRTHVRLTGGQASNLLWPMAMANALAVLPPGPGAEAGDEVDVLVLAD
jgi:molybdopterin biosynthesis enzyme